MEAFDTPVGPVAAVGADFGRGDRLAVDQLPAGGDAGSVAGRVAATAPGEEKRDPAPEPGAGSPSMPLRTGSPTARARPMAAPAWTSSWG
ncbi:hypothetical protein [Kitasatospora paranensis]|uniref:Uncharacterized protein n=1 Tax=Kitasatospora paranensis TaxID=258053 RepID=A0ABW2FXF0_9ACTN